MAALATAGVFAVPASAHNSVWSVTCNSVSVHLKDYDKQATNSVTLQIVGGEGVLAFNPDFGGSYTYDESLPAHDTPLQLHLVVKAGDNAKYNVDETKTSPVCEKPPTTPPPPTTTPPTTAPPTTAPPTTPPTTAPPTTPTPTATTTAPVAATSSAPASGGLADTGSSSATPMIAGIAAAAVVVGAGALVVARKRRSSSHR
ncbi:LAETG motif-containing sortase-dependent surface protein [Streptomyces sp. V4-01]|uniref:LAETG motif-containing sortase-dependent surface protein n=1 Tax=Actinacidiphila polyblastidii TaxID=3110430 RepID=A0ABU7PAG5_9ACTN|nr:LAETG motif-containing sortase-dependent surface protein [Streptomyces sp. V4-01]